MGGGPESRCLGRVYGLDGAVRSHSLTNSDYTISYVAENEVYLHCKAK